MMCATGTTKTIVGNIWGCSSVRFRAPDLHSGGLTVYAGSNPVTSNLPDVRVNSVVGAKAGIILTAFFGPELLEDVSNLASFISENEISGFAAQAAHCFGVIVFAVVFFAGFPIDCFRTKRYPTSRYLAFRLCFFVPVHIYYFVQDVVPSFFFLAFPSFLSILSLMKSVRGQVWNQVKRQVWSQVRRQTRERVRGLVWNQVLYQVCRQVNNQVKNRVWD